MTEFFTECEKALHAISRSIELSRLMWIACLELVEGFASDPPVVGSTLSLSGPGPQRQITSAEFSLSWR